ncbi:chlorohydrolase [Streptococcus pneumoniae]|nr:chlorohydrolase [Streptococcus pneumoniae]
MVFRLGVNNWGFKEIENKKPSKNSIAGENEIILNENQRANSEAATGCSKPYFEVVDRTAEVSSKHCFEVADRADVV